MQHRKRKISSSAPDPQQQIIKEIDYLQKQYPWQSRECITNAFPESGFNGRKTLKILNNASPSKGFAGSAGFSHLN